MDRQEQELAPYVNMAIIKTDIPVINQFNNNFNTIGIFQVINNNQIYVELKRNNPHVLIKLVKPTKEFYKIPFAVSAFYFLQHEIEILDDFTLYLN